jgi:hypothetical protein
VKFHQQLHKFLEQMPVFGPICKKTANFTPDLGPTTTPQWVAGA